MASSPLNNWGPLGLVRLACRIQVVDWLAPVRLLARLDTPLTGSLAIEGNLRLEGWAFWHGQDGQVRHPRVELRCDGQVLACTPLAVARPDVNAAYGLAPDTVPLGFRFLLNPMPLAGPISLHIELEDAHCTLAWIERRPASEGLEALVEEAVQVRGPLRSVARPGLDDERKALVRSLATGPTWDGSHSGTVDGLVHGQVDGLVEGLERDLDLLQQLLKRRPDSLQANTVLAHLARRYGLALTRRIMAHVNQEWLHPLELEYTQHGVKRSFRFWRGRQKATAMGRSSAALRRWQAEGIACFHSSGTLLGLVREGDLLAHDDDIDAVAIVPLGDGETPEQAIAALERKLLSLGHRTRGNYRYHRHVEHGGSWFDIFIATLRGQEITFWGTKIWTTRLETVLPLQNQSIGGLDCVLPAKPEQVLAGLYGQNWRIPTIFYYTSIHRALGMGSHAAELINRLEDQQP